jgi:hypothetical protein
VALVCAVWRVARSTVYARRVGEPWLETVTRIGPTSDDRGVGRHPRTPRSRGKRGPRTPVDDVALLGEIRAVLAASPFHTEGHRKVQVRLRGRGIRVGKARVLRLMRAGQLLAPTRRGQTHGDRTHAGTITTQRPGRAVGDRRDPVLHATRRLVLVLRRDRSLRRGHRGVARGEGG